ncbi:MAG TPA: polysaccharide deacetylase family protein [Candidatus Binataceae bacterium]|jgi:peptidoglycan/xylan/chitin deacetylase (PgdA/CDA1 family)|nr:polysaccharide deacetylase family protein [Candidatus Binataceae bacterium]
MAASPAFDELTSAPGLRLDVAAASTVIFSAVAPVFVLAIKGQNAGAALLAGASAALAAAALRICASSAVRTSTRFRRALLVLAAGQAAVLAVSIAALGVAYVNLDSLHDERLYFHLLVTVPLGLGLLELALALLPPTLRANCIVFLVLWIITELIFGRLLRPVVEGEPRSLMQDTYYRSDSAIGYGLAPNNRAVHVKRLGTRQVMSASYVIDGFGRRLTLPYAADGRSNFLLFFGDSNTFGEGVNQSETLPYQVAQLAPRYHPYNYALSGYGPAQALDLVKSRNLRMEVAEPQGLALFVFIPPLIDRVRGGSLVSAGWGRHFSRYEIDGNNQLVRRGDFVHSRPLMTLFYYLVSCSNVAAYFGLSFPRAVTEGDLDLTARVLAQCQRQLKRQLNVSGFYVVLAPARTGEPLISRRLIPYLRAHGLSYLDLTDMFDAATPGYHLPDQHFSPVSDRLIATRLVRDLEIGAAPAPDPLDPAQAIAPMQVAVTVDDLPFDAPHLNRERMMAIERNIARALKVNDVRESYGFAIGIEAVKFPGSIAALKDWLEEGYPLGNHTYSHLGLSTVSAAEYIADIERDDQFLNSVDPAAAPLQKRRFFRYPYLEEGDNLEKREAVRDYLLRNGYRIAEVTIDYQDWAWDDAYLRCIGEHNTNAVQWLRLHVLDAARRHLRRSQKLAQLIFGRDIKQILLLHLSTLNSLALQDVLKAMRIDGVRFITLEEALADPVYQIDPKVVSSGGRTFLSQMSEARHLKDPYLETVYTEQMLDGICQTTN